MAKKLNKKDLEKINAGERYQSLENLSFLYGLNFHVEVHTFRFPILYKYQFTKAGKITKKGYTFANGYYSACYYITCSDVDYSGWYDEEYLQDYSFSSWEKIDTSKVKVTVVEE